MFGWLEKRDKSSVDKKLETTERFNEARRNAYLAEKNRIRNEIAKAVAERQKFARIVSGKDVSDLMLSTVNLFTRATLEVASEEGSMVEDIIGFRFISSQHYTDEVWVFLKLKIELKT